MHAVESLAGLVLILLLLSSCATLPPIDDEAAAGHILSIGRDGELEAIEPGEKIVLNPGVAQSVDSHRPFQRIIDGIRNFPRNENGTIDVLIFVHGGLNTKKKALDRALKKFRLIKFAQKTPQYPVFVNWRSGPIATYWAHLTRIRQGEISKTAKWTSPVYLLTDVGNALVNAPKSWIVTSEHMLQSTLLADHDYLDALQGGTGDIYFTGNTGDYARLGRGAWWLATSPFKLVSTPFTYTLAKPAWDIMLRRTNTPFYTPSDLANDDDDFEFGKKPGTGALLRFLVELKAAICTHNLPVRITIVGHSMGAIIVNKVIGLDLGLPLRNIVHMASADSINNLFEKVVPYVAANDVQFYSLSLHPENEDREVSAWGLTPSGSLLVWIDDMFTTPETVMDKRSGRWDNMARAIPLLPKDVREKMHFKIFGLNDHGSDLDENELLSEPQKHGQFDDLPFWSERSWWQ